VRYQAVILNFDQGTVNYVSAQDMPKPKQVVATASGSSPPPTQTPPKK
jgi:hypothetical protein